MCGIAGILDLRPGRGGQALEAVGAMSACIAHRGPDSEGVWQGDQGRVTLAHRRLAILDLSPAGHQPMHSPGGRFTAVYNGEIYNFAELRRPLEADGVRFRGHSDTEVMLALFERHGVGATIERLNGMFGIAVWDQQERRLHLVRDRVGIKPVYHWRRGPLLLFASQLSSLAAHPAFARDIDPDAVHHFFNLGYIPGPRSIYRDAVKLAPGAILEVDASGDEPKAVEHRYWRPRAGRPAAAAPGSALETFDGLIRDAVGLQLVADVPVGVFLSGGIDSSLVAAVSQRVSERPVHTFTVGFREKAYDESPFAEAIARHLGTEHTTVFATADEALAVVPRLADIYDEPFADSSQIPTVLISEIARRQVTVILSGDGGDELFHGYTRYPKALAFHRGTRGLPMRRGLARLAAAVGDAAGSMPPAARRRAAATMKKLHVFSELAGYERFRDLYFRYVTIWRGAPGMPQLVPGFRPFDLSPFWDGEVDHYLAMSLLDEQVYLPDDILVKTDRASMSVALEARVPVLDHRIVEFANALALEDKVGPAAGKLIMRRALARYVPEALFERPKRGFSVPVQQWLRGPLRAWARDLVEDSQAARAGLFDGAVARRMLADHLEWRRDWASTLWCILMFEAWYRRHHAR